MAQPDQRASVVGLGVIGGSLALALKRLGWAVTGSDLDRDHAAAAARQGVIDDVPDLVHPDSDVVFVATPPSTLPAVIGEVLIECSCPVTDTGSVKSAVVAACENPRFVPGHPMSGSELSRLEGASPSLFEGATWVLTPTESTDEGALSTVMSLVQQFKAELRLMDATDHDRLVAAVSHLPHLAATALINSAFGQAQGHEPVLARLAAGGFRDMTRVASSDLDIWLDICTQNRPAITSVLDEFIHRLEELRDLIDHEEHEVTRHALTSAFDQARRSRATLPVQPPKQVELVVRLTGDQKVITVLQIATALDVSVKDHYVTNGATLSELHLSVLQSQVDLLRGGLAAKGIKVEDPEELSNQP